MNQDVNQEPVVFSSGGNLQNESDAKDPSKAPFWKRYAGVITVIAAVVPVIGVTVTLAVALNASMDAGFDRITDSLNSIRADMATEFGNLRADIGSVRSEFANEIRSVRDEIKGVRQDLHALGQHIDRLDGKLAESDQHEASDPKMADNTNH